MHQTKSSSPIHFESSENKTEPFCQIKTNVIKTSGSLREFLKNVKKTEVKRQEEVDSNFGSGISDSISPIPHTHDEPRQLHVLQKPPLKPYTEFNAESKKFVTNDEFHRLNNVYPGGIRKDDFRRNKYDKRSY